jgi:glycosyltransferase involved in cell wall biosynthesis
MRYAWDLTFDYLNRNSLGKGLPGIFTRYFLHQLRQWDVISANRVDYFLANSQHTARRIWRCYRRRAKVIYPPVDLDKFTFSEKKAEFYLTVSRLVSYKKVSLIVEAFNQLGKPLVVIGDGPELSQIRQNAGSNIQILGAVSDEVLNKYMSEAKAFIYAACEDFGIAMVEAQACGTPVIAYQGGGAIETVKDIREFPETGTGLLFQPQTVQGLVEAVKSFTVLEKQFLPENNRLQANRFSPKIFKKSYLEFLDRCLQEFPHRKFSKGIFEKKTKKPVN